MLTSAQKDYLKNLLDSFFRALATSQIERSLYKHILISIFNEEEYLQIQKLLAPNILRQLQTMRACYINPSEHFKGNELFKDAQAKDVQGYLVTKLLYNVFNASMRLVSASEEEKQQLVNQNEKLQRKLQRAQQKIQELESQVTKNQEDDQNPNITSSIPATQSAITVAQEIKEFLNSNSQPNMVNQKFNSIKSYGGGPAQRDMTSPSFYRESQQSSRSGINLNALTKLCMSSTQELICKITTALKSKVENANQESSETIQVCCLLADLDNFNDCLLKLISQVPDVKFRLSETAEKLIKSKEDLIQVINKLLSDKYFNLFNPKADTDNQFDFIINPYRQCLDGLGECLQALKKDLSVQRIEPQVYSGLPQGFTRT